MSEEAEATYQPVFEDISEGGRKKEVKAFGIVSMVLGIISFVKSFLTIPIPTPFLFFYPYIGIILAIIDNKKNGYSTNFGKIGLLTSIFGIILNIVFSIISLLIIIFVILICIAYFVIMFVLPAFGYDISMIFG